MAEHGASTRHETGVGVPRDWDIECFCGDRWSGDKEQVEDSFAGHLLRNGVRVSPSFFEYQTEKNQDQDKGHRWRETTCQTPGRFIAWCSCGKSAGHNSARVARQLIEHHVQHPDYAHWLSFSGKPDAECTLWEAICNCGFRRTSTAQSVAVGFIESHARKEETKIARGLESISEFALTVAIDQLSPEFVNLITGESNMFRLYNAAVHNVETGVIYWYSEEPISAKDEKSANNKVIAALANDVDLEEHGFETLDQLLDAATVVVSPFRI